MKKVKFIHAADLHLDSPMVGLKFLPASIFSRLKESTFVALERIVNKAIEEKVDFVILAGDLFDSEDRSIKAQTRLRNEMKRLQTHGISVFAIHGNHDHLDGSWAHLDMPENVHIFSTEVEKKLYQTANGSHIHLYGFSYPSRHVFERKIVDYRKEEEADFHIGILHGNIEGNHDHGNYAPFSLKELLDKDFDYWALGHIHKGSILSQDPPVIYPGNTQGRNRKETGIKGGYLIELEEGKKSIDFFPTSDCVWIEKEINVSEVNGFEQLYLTCKSVLDTERENKIGILLKLHLTNLLKENNPSERDILNDLLEALQEDEREETSFVWPYAVTAEEQSIWDRETLANQTDFYGELFRLSEEPGELERGLDLLYKHPQARKFLNPLTDEEKKEMIQYAECFLVEQLLKE
ncbi:DNA repair exonuclease [Robertmurraya korlensis]|uniref:metallophosphoesterase family protein n=1 Tax=Robertmurraya korlensis TaxID=519977 RepID=UPI0020407EB4|nr:DNA repair exonuclease [Robertmurraya korlensis]MCM3602268.1 DNA repair exonuclease [Robertmurraya korlensis]